MPPVVPVRIHGRKLINMGGDEMLPVDNQCNMTMMPVEILVEDG
jgi:hypothetical protein